MTDKPFVSQYLEDGSKLQIDVATDETTHRFRVRKVIFGFTDHGPVIVAKWGLSFLTGEWIEVKEGERYPEECIYYLVSLTKENTEIAEATAKF
jgi:hypothetical protein